MNTRSFAAFLLLAAVFGLAGSCKSSQIHGPGYFLVAEVVPQHNDSYILPLTDPDRIRQGRGRLAGREPSQIVVARIARGSGDGDHLNRNLAGTDKAPWSWHVVEKALQHPTSRVNPLLTLLEPLGPCSTPGKN